MPGLIIECDDAMIFAVYILPKLVYTEATLKFLKLNTQAQRREAVAQGRSLSPTGYGILATRYNNFFLLLGIFKN
ncbi:MAG: hypothetical protein LBJ00_09690 [Planctomycetaceae bacterium]|nr:hypothetical protein [Planctomycetaceae bacterium]